MVRGGVATTIMRVKSGKKLKIRKKKSDGPSWVNPTGCFGSKRH
jgi:hypothetical protein